MKSLIAGSQVFALLMVFVCVILYTMWSGKILEFLELLCLSSIRMICVKILLAVCMSESGLCAFHKLCPDGFLVVSKSLSAFL